MIIKNYNQKRGDDIIFQIIDNMVRRINTLLKKNKIKKNFTYSELFGCEPMLLKEYLKKLTDNMSFDNYPEWEVDHIIPIASFDLSNDDQFRKCFHYTNLQPLWKIDNLHKADKIIEQTTK